MERVDVSYGGVWLTARGASVGACKRARGTTKRGIVRQGKDTLKCCSGRALTAARGTSIRAGLRRAAGSSRYCSGRMQTAARGVGTRAGWRRLKGTSRCCSGRAPTAAPSGEVTPMTPMTNKTTNRVILIPLTLQTSVSRLLP